MFAFFGFEFHFPASTCSYGGVPFSLSVIIHGKSNISQVMAQFKTNQIKQNMIRLSNWVKLKLCRWTPSDKRESIDIL